MSIFLAEDILRVPQKVDMSQQHNCPVCDSGFDGLICDNCGFEQPPEGLRDPQSISEQQNAQGKDPQQEQTLNPQSGENMSRSRFNDLLSGDSVPVTSRQAKIPNPPVLDQRSTINLDSGFGPGREAPAPVGDDDFDLESFRSRPQVDVLDLDADDVTGGPGDPAVRIPKRPNGHSSKKASRRLARIYMAQIDELLEEAQNQVNQVQQAVQELGTDSGNGETSSDLGAVDSQLAQLQSTLGELSEVAGAEVAPPATPEEAPPVAPPAPGEGGGDPTQGAPVDPQTAQAAKRLSKKVTRSRNILRAAYRILADDTIPDQSADEQVNDLIDELEDEVQQIDQEVNGLDESQGEDNQIDQQAALDGGDATQGDESGLGGPSGPGPIAGDNDRGTFSKKVSARRKAQLRRELLASIRSARKHIARVAYLQKFADEDEDADEKVDDEIGKVEGDLEKADETAKELEESQDEDLKESRKKILPRRARKVSAATRVAKALAKARTAGAKFAEGDDDAADDDLKDADDELSKAEEEVKKDESSSKEDSDTKESKKTSRRVYAEDDVDDDDFDKEQSTETEDEDEPEEGLDDEEESENGEGAHDDKEASKKSFRRRANEALEETHQWTDVQDLDSGAPKTKEQLMHPKSVDVLAPVEEGNQLEKADTPTRFNDGTETGFDDQNPPSKAQWPYDSPSGYDYKHSAGKDKERLFTAIKLTDQLVRLGMTSETNKMRHIAEFERMQPEYLAGFAEALKSIEATGTRKSGPQPQRIAANRSAAPSLGRAKLANSTEDNTDYLAFL